jgi:site-specific recombinase XerD
MRKTAPYSSTSTALTVSELQSLTDGWLLDGELRQLSPRTLEARQRLVGKFLWFLSEKGFTCCGRLEVRAFLAHVSRGHEEPAGRWGISRLNRQVRPSTTTTYFNILRSPFSFLVEEGAMEASPIETLRPPIFRPDQVQPFNEEQIAALLVATRRSPHPCRDEAIVLFLLDTGARSNEVCSLRVKDVDLAGRRCTVQGKGNKARRLCFGTAVRKGIGEGVVERGPGDRAASRRKPRSVG